VCGCTVCDSSHWGGGDRNTESWGVSLVKINETLSQKQNTNKAMCMVTQEVQCLPSVEKPWVYSPVPNTHKKIP
jgi:hypothetical protein